MVQLVKGSMAPRVIAICQLCGCTFEKSSVHPYIVKCVTCRGSKVKNIISEPIISLEQADKILSSACLKLKLASDQSDDAWLEALKEMHFASIEYGRSSAIQKNT